MQDQIGPAFLSVLSFLFGSYGARELALAYRIESIDEWIGKAALGTGSLTLCVLFASCSYQLIRGIITAVS